MFRNRLTLVIVGMSVCLSTGWGCPQLDPADTDVMGDGNVAPTISEPAVQGQLTASQQGTITIQCRASDEDGTVEAVEVDLSPLGGTKQSLSQQDGHLWTWTGPVTPNASGTITVLLAATNNSGVTATSPVEVPVAAAPSDPDNPDNPADPDDPGTDPGQPPPGDGPLFMNTLVEDITVAGVPCSVKFMCNVYSPAGQIVSVTVDLNELGGQTGVLLTNTWQTEYYLRTSVTPPTAGDKIVTFHATDDAGRTSSMQAVMKVSPNQG